MELYGKLAEKVEEGKQNEVKELVAKGIADGVSVSGMLNEGLVAGMNAIGTKFRDGDVFVPEVLVAARAMKAGLELLKPLLLKENVRPRGTVVMGTVKGDLHDIGKNIVCYMLQGAGYEVVDIGIDVPKEKFIEAAREHGAGVIGLSSLLTTTMVYMKEIMDAINASDIAGKVRVMVGGAPVTQSYADEIGAHGYAADAATAADVVNTLVGKQARQ